MLIYRHHTGSSDHIQVKYQILNRVISFRVCHSFNFSSLQVLPIAGYNSIFYTCHALEKASEMSARRINNRMMRSQGTALGPGYHSGRQDIVSRKRDERMMREAFRREKKMASYLEDDQNYPSFKNQLAKIGLELRDIPGDG